MQFPLWKKFLNSRKFWVALAGFVTLIGTSMEDGILTSEEILALAGIIITYIFSVAFEDGMSARVNWNSLTTPTTIVTTETTSPPVVVTDAPTNVTVETVETIPAKPRPGL